MGIESKFRVTKQRTIILEELRNVRTHPTALELYIIVKEQLPKISLGTIYRNLEFLAKIGKIIKLESAGCENRYDGFTEEHHHIRCLECGKVGDIFAKCERDIKVIAQEKTDFLVEEHKLEFTGYCPVCKEKIGIKNQRRKKNAEY
jgi:Fur family transcriptional regulator, ferric uptake regulator